MTTAEMNGLQREYGSELRIDEAYHLHDEDEWNKFEISFRGIIVGSELVTADFVRNNIKKYFS